MAKKLLRVSIGILLSFFIAFGAEAQVGSSLDNSLTIQPAIFELAVEGGDSIQRQIVVKNNYREELDIKIEIRGFTSASKFGGIHFLDKQNEGQHSARSWFEISRGRLVIPPRAEKKIRIGVNVPVGIKPGSYYAAVIFMPQVKQQIDISGTSLIPAVGTLFLFDVGRSRLAIKDSLAIVDFRFDNLTYSHWFDFLRKVEGFFHELPVLVLDKPPSSFRIELKNSSNFHLRPQGELLVLNLFQKKVNDWSFPPITILPVQNRIIDGKLEWKSGFLIPSFLGRYKVYLRVGDVFESEQKEMILWIMPGGFLLSTAIVFCLFWWFVIKYKRRILKFFSILIKGK